MDRSAAAEDFGHIVHRIPEEVARPRSAAEVAEAVKSAARRGLRFAARGEGHSTFGRSQAEGGVVAEMSALREIGPVEGGRVVVEAGAKWSEVLAATLPHGMTPPVLTDYLELSVGGTLAVGGVGGTISAHGLQSDNVLELEVVTGDGLVVVCSATQNADLFDAARAGLGQVGVITRATLGLIEAPRSVRRHPLLYRDLAAMLRDSRRLAAEERFDALQGAIVAAPGGGWAYSLDAVRFFGAEELDDEALLAGLSDDPARREPATMTYADYAHRFAALEEALRSNGQWLLPHPWLMTFVGDCRVEEVVAAELAALDPAADLGPFGQVVVSPIRRNAIVSPMLRMPADELCHTFNLVRVPASDDAGETERLVDANRATYERVKAAGGTLYPVSALAFSPREWREHFGASFVRLEAAKARYDPARILTPGYEVF